MIYLFHLLSLLLIDGFNFALGHDIDTWTMWPSPSCFAGNRVVIVRFSIGCFRFHPQVSGITIGWFSCWFFY
uniref:Putative secreted protein n=1 Tax=Anopheles darlingi TaxID=43151 RepID=A0A2M4DLB0_ANODA